MPKNPKTPPYTSTMFEEKSTSRYKTTVPKPIGKEVEENDKVKYEVEFKNKKLIWTPME